MISDWLDEVENYYNRIVDCKYIGFNDEYYKFGIVYGLWDLHKITREEVLEKLKYNIINVLS